jgi:uncharacterized protein
MLELRPCCELCGKDLPPPAADARICSFECTFCAECVDRVLSNVCPNCGGGLYPRPVRPQAKLEHYPPSRQRKVKPLDPVAHAALLERYRDLPPAER